MSRIEGSVIVNAAVGEVFGFVSDWQRWSDWFEGVSDFRTAGDVVRGNGARYSYRARMLGIPAKVETEIHDFIENKGWIGIGTRGLPHKTQWVFEAQGDSTKFTYILEYRLPVPLLGALLDSLLVRREWRRIIDKSLQNLHAHFSSPGLKMPTADVGGA